MRHAIRIEPKATRELRLLLWVTVAAVLLKRRPSVWYWAGSVVKHSTTSNSTLYLVGLTVANWS